MKAGTNAPTLTEDQYTELINEAEGFVCAQARYDYVAHSGSISTEGLQFLKDIVSSKAAIDVIKKDMSGFTSRAEAQTMLNVLWNSVAEGINIIRDDKFRTFILGGTA